MTEYRVIPSYPRYEISRSGTVRRPGSGYRLARRNVGRAYRLAGKDGLARDVPVAELLAEAWPVASVAVEDMSKAELRAEILRLQRGGGAGDRAGEVARLAKELAERTAEAKRLRAEVDGLLARLREPAPDGSAVDLTAEVARLRAENRDLQAELESWAGGVL